MQNNSLGHSSSLSFAKRMLFWLLALMLPWAQASGNPSQEQSEIMIPACSPGDSCVMVFGSVGESFQYKLGQSDASADFAIGLDESGAICKLPEGLKLNRDEGVLTGTPLRGGFHEFVVLHTDKGVTRERVLLIDIQDAGVNPMLDSYASLLIGAAR